MTKQSPASGLPTAPTYEALPKAKLRAARGGPELRELNVELEVVSPIFGGGYAVRALDDIDTIRAASIRGHLRFWWRALYAAQYENTEALYAHEGALWGRASTDAGGRSIVEIRVDVVKKASAIDKKEPHKSSGAYALWPARSTKGGSAAPRREPGTRFQLTLRVAPAAETQVKNALRAFIVFGGYGGRTRRGLGSLTVVSPAQASPAQPSPGQEWLPTAASAEALAQLFGTDILAAPTAAPGDVPWLGGAALHVGAAEKDPVAAWTTALGWLSEFRQGTDGEARDRAREPGTGKQQPSRPSISNWPEADKLRHIRQKTCAHHPRHNATVVWPRAGFGLPLGGQFQTTDRNDPPGAYQEPKPFTLRWRSPTDSGEFDEHDRLASPLIVKALPLENRTFVPCALWLNRAYPAESEVFLKGEQGSQAPFDRLVADGDIARFSALADKASLRQAFLDWLGTKHKTTAVAP